MRKSAHSSVSDLTDKDKQTSGPLLRKISVAFSWIDDEQRIAAECRSLVDQLGPNYIDRTGNSLLHIYVLRVRDGSVACRNRALPIYVFSQMGVPVNGQNNGGDSPLHLSVRHLPRYPEVFEALIQCGADPDLRNKFALTPRIELREVQPLPQILEKYEPTLLQCVTNGWFDYKVMQDCVRKWYAVNTNVQDGCTILDMIWSLPKQLDEKTKKSIDFIRDQANVLKLVHAVMANDREHVLELSRMSQDRRLNINIRHFSKFGKTPLVCAIYNNSSSLVSILLANGASVNIRVRLKAKTAYEPEDGRTSPLLHLALSREVVNFEIFRSLVDNSLYSDLFERSSEGNTLFLEALENDRSLDEIRFLLVDALKYAALFDRSVRGENIRQICQRLARNDVDNLIERSLLTLLKDRDSRASRSILVNLAASFMGASFFQIDEMLQDNESHEACRGFLAKLEALEQRGRTLFQAIAENQIEVVKRCNIANFRDKAGHTALTKAIVHERLDLVEWLLVERPELKYFTDNKNRFPLHYAYLLPDEKREPFVSLLIENFQPSLKMKRETTALDTSTLSVIARIHAESEMFDKDGLLPTDYKKRKYQAQRDMFFVEAGCSVTLLEGAFVSVQLQSE